MIGFTYELPGGVVGKRVSAVEVGPFDEASTARELNRFYGTDIQGMARTDTYLLVHPEDFEGIEKLLEGKPFVDPVMNRATLNSPLMAGRKIDFDFVLQSMLNPGTSDAEGDTCLREVLLSLDRQFTEEDVGFRTRQYFVKADKMTDAQLEEVSAFLANLDLNVREIVSRETYEKSGVVIPAPIVVLKPEIKVETFDLNSMSDEQLVELNEKRRIAANLEELHQFRDMYKDEEFMKKRRELGLDEKPTDVELETWFGLRSEHCFHKEFNAHITIDDKVNDPVFASAFKKGWLSKNDSGEYVLESGIFKKMIEEPARIIYDRLEARGNNWIADMFRDNAGTIYYDPEYMVCIKVETHNSPSNKEPGQGSKTGLDGVIRDGMGNMMGTFEVIMGLFYYLTGDPRYIGWLPKGVKHPYVLLKGITRGTREAGNENQIPVEAGGVITDPRYVAKILDYCGIVGFSPVKSPEGFSYLGKHPKVGDLVFVVGQAVGIDGIHGATESSLSASKKISLGHVQADFSFIQAKSKVYMVECGRAGLITSTTDFGAMGLGSAACETAQSTGGLEMDLAKHPVKYKGIQPWQINCSETQNRMLMDTEPENREEANRRADLHDVSITEIGKLTDSGYIHLTYEGKTVALIDIEKLFNKEPRKFMHATWNVKVEDKEKNPEIKGKYSLEESLCMVMGQPDVASKEWFFRQKDSSVKGATIQGPLIGLKQEVDVDATMQKPLETEGRDFGAIAYALGIAPKVSDIDPYHSGQKAFLDMAGKIIALGGALPDMNNPKWDGWAVCGNFCQPNSEGRTTLTKESGEHNLASLVREAIGIRDAIEATNIPVISGKDSMKCSCVYDIDLDEFMKSSDSEFAKAFMALPEKVREDLGKVKEKLGELYDSETINSIVLQSLPADLRRHIIIAERKRTLIDEETEGKYEVMGKAVEIHDPDTYLASAAVKIDDYRKCVSQDLKQEGDIIYVLGTTKAELGASQYLSAVGYNENGAPVEGGKCPRANLDEFVKCANALHKAIGNEVVASCSYVHNGGVAAALAKAAIAGEKGAEITTAGWYDACCSTEEELLYSETPGRWIVAVAPEDQERFEEIVGFNSCSRIGKVISKDIVVQRMDYSSEIISLDKVKKHYQEPLAFGLNDLKNKEGAA